MIVDPLAMYSASPAPMLRVASVAMNGCGSRPLTRMIPLTAPIASPARSVAPIARTVEWVSRKTTVQTTHPSETFDPIERSMPRVRITRSWPSAITQTPADCCRTLPTFP
jgi:hypothetical protein